MASNNNVPVNSIPTRGQSDSCDWCGKVIVIPICHLKVRLMEATVSDGFVPNQIGIEPKPLHVSVLTGEQASGLLQCHKGEKFWWFGKIKFLFLSLRARIRMKCQQGVFSWPFLLMGFYKIRVWAPVANFFWNNFV